MKKTLIFLVVSVLLILTSCKFAFVDSDSEKAKKCLEDLLINLQEENTEKTKSLFALNAIIDLENFDEDIFKLFQYFNGNYETFISDGLGTFNEVEHGKNKKYYLITSDVKTTENTYRFAIKWYVEDDFDSENIGIHSLYVIKFEDDPYSEYSYGGDGLWTNGINIGKVWIGQEETK